MVILCFFADLTVNYKCKVNVFENNNKKGIHVTWKTYRASLSPKTVDTTKHKLAPTFDFKGIYFEEDTQSEKVKQIVLNMSKYYTKYDIGNQKGFVKVRHWNFEG